MAKAATASNPTEDLLKELGKNIGNEEVVAAVAAPVKPVASKPKTIRIILEENEGIPPTGQYFGYNGAGFIIRPGEVVTVPMAIKEILDHAIETKSITNGNGQVIGTRQKMRYPYRIIRDEDLVDERAA